MATKIPLTVYSGVVQQVASGDAVAATSGGTGVTSCALGDLLYASGANTWASLATNTTATRKFLRAVSSAAPAWDTLQAGDIPDISATYAPIVSPALTGTPTAPTAAAGTNSTQIATTAYADALAPAGSIQMYAGTAAPSGWLLCDGTNTWDRVTYSALATVLAPSKGTVTLTIASPCVVTLNSHGLSTNDTIWLETSAGGALPTGLVVATLYYVKVINSNTFNLATTAGGASINTSGTQSGTHTLYYTIWGGPSAAGKFKVPDLRGRAPIGVGTGSGLTARALAGSGGEETHKLTGAESGTSAHGHGITDPAHYHSITIQSPGGGAAAGTWTGNASNGVNMTTDSKTTGITINNATAADATNAHNNMQPWLGLNFIIKT